MMDEAVIASIVEFVRDLSPNKIKALANRFSEEPIPMIDNSKSELIGSKDAREDLERLLGLCRARGVSGEVLAGMLMASRAATDRVLRDQSTEFVWTGPTTRFVATRRTEQVMLDLIKNAENDLFMVSFVAYDVEPIMNGLRSAVQRGVEVSILLEAAEDEGGTVNHDGIAMMRDKIPSVTLYAWKNQATDFEGGRVHAKIAVADGKAAFLTSANLTGYAMQKNIEAGLLVSGGMLPHQIMSHLRALIDTKILVPV